jgi:Spy/CpxP family protein refolding chaperone
MVKKSLYLALVSILLSVPWIISGCGHRLHGERAEWMTEKIASKLELNEAQKQQLNSFKDELMDKKRELRASRSAVVRELIAQLQSEKIDQEHLKGVIEKEETKLDAMVSTFVTRLAEFHSSLTPEQRTQLVEMVQKWEDHKKKHDHFYE